MSAVVPSGWASGETDPSGFKTTEPDRPIEPGPDSATLTVTLPAGLDELAKTGRAAPERAATATERTETEAICWKEALTFGPGASVSVKVRSCVVRF